MDIAVSGYRFLQGQIKSWVIVCPSIAKDVWAMELADTLDVPHTVEIVEEYEDESTVIPGDGSAVSEEIVSLAASQDDQSNE